MGWLAHVKGRIMALLSIITTCRNAQDCIGRTIRSVLMQDFRDFEYIIMDGVSEDDTLPVAESFREEFEKAGIPYRIYSEKDHGIYEGMNHAIAHAEGDYVNFMNADDCLLHDHTLRDIAERLSTVEGRKPDILYGGAIAMEFGRAYYYVKDLSLIERRMPFSHQSVFAAKSLLLEFPFQEKFRIGADYDFLLTAYQNGCFFYDLEMTVCRVTLDGLSSLDLIGTFTETTQIQKDHGIVLYSDKAYAKKIRSLTVKQFVMDHFPKCIIHLIRKIQRIHRGQNAHPEE